MTVRTEITPPNGPTYRLALLDVDGTLRHMDRWNEDALELIADLHAAGIQVALCSGRTTGSMTRIVSDVPDVDFVASGSGATVLRRDADEAGWDVLVHRPLPREAVETAIRTAAAEGVEVWGFTDREWLIHEQSPWATAEATYVDDSPRVAPLIEHADGFGKLLFLLPDPAQGDDLKGLLRVPGVQLVRSGVHYLDLVSDDAHSAKGGDVIVAALGVGWEDVIAIGDSENDHGMLSRAGLAVCIPPIRAAELGVSEGANIRIDVDDTAGARRALGEVLRR